MKVESVEDGQSPEADVPNPKANKSISIADLVMRAFAALGALGSAVIMGTTNQTLSDLFKFKTEYNDLPAFM